MKNPWVTKSSKKIYENPWIRLDEHQVIHPGGKDGIYGVVHFKSIATGIIPLDDDYNTWIVGQYRFTLNRYTWEIPEGGGSLEVEPLESAKRELREETGIIAEEWIELFKMDLSNSVTDEEGVAYVAKNLSFQEPEPDDQEELQIRKLPFEELYQMAMNGEVTDGLAIAAIFKTALLIKEGKI